MPMGRSVIGLLALMTVACGGSASPTAPTPPPPPNLAGQWSGAYTVASCTTTGAASASGFCNAVSLGGGLVFTPQQSGENLSGPLSVGGFVIPATGTIRSGTVALAGSGPIQLGATLSLLTFSGTLSGTRITGSMSFIITTDVPQGSATVAGPFALVQH